MSINLGRDDRVLIHCFAGCSADEIVRAIGLELRDLFSTGAGPEPKRHSSTRPKSKPAAAPVPRDLVEALVKARRFPFEWVTAKHLARAPRRAMEREVVRNWEYLSARGSIPVIVDFAGLIRRVAVLRHGDVRLIQDPAHVSRSVDRLLREINDEVTT